MSGRPVYHAFYILWPNVRLFLDKEDVFSLISHKASLSSQCSEASVAPTVVKRRTYPQ